MFAAPVFGLKVSIKYGKSSLIAARVVEMGSERIRIDLSGLSP